MEKDSISYESLTSMLQSDDRLSDLEKCVVLFQIFTYVGEDIYDKNISNYPIISMTHNHNLIKETII